MHAIRSAHLSLHGLKTIHCIIFGEELILRNAVMNNYSTALWTFRGRDSRAEMGSRPILYVLWGCVSS